MANEPRQAPTTHHYRARCRWSGSTGAGYDAYSRHHTAEAVPADAILRLSSDPAFRGDATLLNPEQLVVLAASSCQLLSFLAVASRARLDVIGYDDEAEAVMPEEDPPARLTRIVLRPHILVTAGAGATIDRVAHLVQVAHRECFIANSLRSEIVVEPTISIT